MTPAILMECPECANTFFNANAYVTEENKYPLGINSKLALEWGDPEAIDGTEKWITVHCDNCDKVLYDGVFDHAKVNKALLKLGEESE
jgi:hypothetical protein